MVPGPGLSSPQVHESFGFLLEHRPPGLGLALASRSDPPLALRGCGPAGS
jgi:ATP/maltotriose-dependent transcriptional regulator MalT